MMWVAMNNGQFAKVFVQSYEDARFGMRLRKYRFISGIVGPVASPDDIVSCGSQLVHRLTPNARVEKELHPDAPAAIVSGSMRSLPMWRRA